MANVALFVDYENLSFVLQRQESCRLNHAVIGEELLKYAETFGSPIQRVMWAEWDRFSPLKRQEQSAQAILTRQGFDCLYLLRPADRSYTEQAILEKLNARLSDIDHVVIVSGDYPFPSVLALDVPTELLLVAPDNARHQFEHMSHVNVHKIQDVLDNKEALQSIQIPQGLELTAFYIWIQRVLQEELRRRNWNGMSFHMLARLLLERGLCDEDMEAQYYINQAVRDGFLERMETELPTGRRVLLKPTIVEQSSEPVWSFDDEFQWAQLIWALSIILERNPWWEYVTFSRLREELEKWSLAPNADVLQKLIEQAVEAGIYELHVEEGGPPLYRKKYKYTLGDGAKEHDRALLIPRLVRDVMKSLLEQNPHWHGVSFSKLLDKLNEHPEIANNDVWIDRLRLKDWCNFLVAIGFLHAFRGRSRMVDGEFRDPPTLLRIVPDHSWIQHLQLLDDKDNKTEDAPVAPVNNPARVLDLKQIDYYRLIVIIEHYLHISNNDAVLAGWMPMSTLFHVMGRRLERAFCNAIVRSAREKGIIEIRTHDPKPGQHPARGAYLALEHPTVEKARQHVLRLLEMVQTLQERHGKVEMSRLKAEMNSDPLFENATHEHKIWLELLQEENLLLVRAPAGGESDEALECNLNYRDRYVLALLDTLYPSPKASEPARTPLNPTELMEDPLSFSEDQLPMASSFDKPN